MGITEEEYREEHEKAIAVLKKFKMLEASFEMKKIKIDHKTTKSVRVDHKTKKPKQKLNKANIDTAIVMDLLELELINEFIDDELIIF